MLFDVRGLEDTIATCKVSSHALTKVETQQVSLSVGELVHKVNSGK